MDNLIIYTTSIPKIRLGKPYDGGYVIGQLDGRYDCLISGGIDDDISVEQHLLNSFAYEIPCFAFDGTINHLPTCDTRIQFIKKNLGNTNNDSCTNLHFYMDKYSDIFMKIDVEGHEYSLFSTFSEMHMLKIKQLVIEIHTPADIQLYPQWFVGLSHIVNDDLMLLLKKLKYLLFLFLINLF